MRQQKADLMIYLSGLEDPVAALDRLLDIAATILPEKTLRSERDWFLNDIGILKIVLSVVF